MAYALVLGRNAEPSAGGDPRATPARSAPPLADAPGRPILDIRVRWRAGQVALGLAGAARRLAALTRPLAPGGASPGCALAVTLAARPGRRGAGAPGEPARPRHGRAARVLRVPGALAGRPRPDPRRRWAGPSGRCWRCSWPRSRWPSRRCSRSAWPRWPPLLAVADAAAGASRPGSAAVAAALGYARAGRSPSTAPCAARSGASAPRWRSWPACTHGIDQLEDEQPRRGARPAARAGLRQVSEEGRRARQLDRAAGAGPGARPAGARGPRRRSAPTPCSTSTSTASARGLPARRRRARRRWSRDAVVPLRARIPSPSSLDRGQSLLRHRLQAAALVAALLQGRGEGRHAAGGAGAHRRRRARACWWRTGWRSSPSPAREPALLGAFAELVARGHPAPRRVHRREEHGHRVQGRLRGLAPAGRPRPSRPGAAPAAAPARRDLVPLEGGGRGHDRRRADPLLGGERLRLGARVRGPRGGAARAHLDGLGAAQRRGAPTCSTTCRAARDRMPILVLDEGRRARSRCWPCRCARATETLGRARAHGRAGRLRLRRPARARPSWPTRPRARSARRPAHGAEPASRRCATA